MTPRLRVLSLPVAIFLALAPAVAGQRTSSTPGIGSRRPRPQPSHTRTR